MREDKVLSFLHSLHENSLHKWLITAILIGIGLPLAATLITLSGTGFVVPYIWNGLLSAIVTVFLWLRHRTRGEQISTRKFFKTSIVLYWITTAIFYLLGQHPLVLGGAVIYFVPFCLIMCLIYIWINWAPSKIQPIISVLILSILIGSFGLNIYSAYKDIKNPRCCHASYGHPHGSAPYPKYVYLLLGAKPVTSPCPCYEYSKKQE